MPCFAIRAHFVTCLAGLRTSNVSLSRFGFGMDVFGIQNNLHLKRNPCKSNLLPYSSVFHLFVVPLYPDIRRIMTEELFRMAHERYVNLYRHTSKERYVELLNHCPDILQHITLKELASYLQITPTHLSRIRKEILSGK